MRTSPAGIAFIKNHEGFRAAPYRDSGGTWTQGYGHIDGVTESSPAIDEAQASAWLAEDLLHIEAWIDRYIHIPLNQNQYDALASLCFNEGYAPLIGTLGHCINDGDTAGGAIQFTRWVFAGKQQVPGLVARRTDEQKLFQTPCNS